MTTEKRTANDTFIGACLEFDDLIAKLRALRENHFNVDGEAGANWGDVGSLNHLNTKLREALAHYGVVAEAAQ